MINYQYETDKVRDDLKRLPDLEKLLARVFTYSIKHRCKAIYFEDVSLIKLKEFRTLLNTMKELPMILAPLMNRVTDFKSARLIELLSKDDGEDQEGMFPANLVQEV